MYAAFSQDETIMGFGAGRSGRLRLWYGLPQGFPRGERDVLVASEPDKFFMPRPSDMRYRWVQVRLDATDVDELRELLIEAWRTWVPNRVSDADEQLHATGPAAPLTG